MVGLPYGCAAFGCKILCCGVCAVIVAIMATWVIAYNEFRYVQFDATLWHIQKESKEAACVAAPYLNDELVHLSCPVTHLPDLAQDKDLQFLKPMFAEPVINGSDLLWETEMYQWKSHQEGRRRTRTVYRLEWHSVDNVENGDWWGNYKNPKPATNAKTGKALANPKSLWIGDPTQPMKGYHLSAYLREQMLRQNVNSLFKNVTPATVYDPPPVNATTTATLSASNFYTCHDNMISTEPCHGWPSSDTNKTHAYRLGGIRMWFERVEPRFVSVIAKQVAAPATGMMAADGMPQSGRRLNKSFLHGFGEYKTDETEVIPESVSEYPPTKLMDERVGSFFTPAYDAEFLYDGKLSLAEMVHKLEDENTGVLWAMRLGGWLLLGFALFLVFNLDNVPVMLDPFGIYVITAGDMIEACTCMMDMCGDNCGDKIRMFIYLLNYFVCCIFALPVALGLIAISWVLARPLWGLGILVVAIALFMAVRYSGKKIVENNVRIMDNRLKAKRTYENLEDLPAGNTNNSP